MSNLLEQAIIDANALRETALKSAQDALIEKYKDEFRESVEKLFEQENTGLTGQETGIQPELSADLSQTDVSDTGQEPGGEAFNNVPSSFLDGDDDEVITIDFDQIEKQLSDALGSSMLSSPEDLENQPEDLAVDQELEQPEVQELAEELDLSEDLEEQEEVSEEQSIDEELELELDEACDNKNTEGIGIDALTEVESDVASLESKKINITKQMANLQKQLADLKGQLSNIDAAKAEVQSQPQNNQNAEDKSSTDQYDITEEEIQELAEEMNIDIEVEGLLDGHMGTHQGEKRELRNMELAAARDECAEDDREEELEKLADLKKELNESLTKNKKYSNLIEELKDNLIVLKEQTEKLSISNAKLLYINKVFANNSLNERQKQNIVESISKAESVLEAKTIFGTLQSTVDGLSNKKSKESLSEALNHGNTVFSVRPKTIKEEIGFSDRLKILAGIK